MWNRIRNNSLPVSNIYKSWAVINNSLVNNLNLDQKSKFRSKIEIWVKNQKLDEKSNFRSKIEL